MSDQFQDITIVAIDPNRTYCPDSSKPAMLDVFLALSAAPPSEWADYFNAQWQMTLYSMKRRAHVSGSGIVIHCALPEIEKHHKPVLKRIIDQTNAAYRQFVQAREAQTKLRDVEEQKRRQEIEQASKDVKFND